MTTIKDVAREAGVSVATVSRFLNGSGPVGADTASKIEAVILRLNYTPNLLARNFRRNESHVILILCPNVTNPYYAHILSGIVETFYEHGYSALIYTTADNPKRESEALDMLTKRRADGAILMAGTTDESVLLSFASRFPVVQCSEYEPSSDFPRVSIDNYQAGLDVMRFLIGLGHRRIATISSENHYISTKLRLQAYQDALRENSITLDERYIALASKDYSFHSGKAKATELLGLAQPPTAIFCISDTLALGAVSAADEMGLQVPRDISITGFDDVEHTTMFHPFITTIAQPCYELGKRSALLLMEKLNQTTSNHHQIFLAHQLIVRETTAGLGHLDQTASTI